MPLGRSFFWRTPLFKSSDAGTSSRSAAQWRLDLAIVVVAGAVSRRDARRSAARIGSRQTRRAARLYSLRPLDARSSDPGAGRVLRSPPPARATDGD